MSRDDDDFWTERENIQQWNEERRLAEPKLYRVTGVIEVYVKAVDPESARRQAEDGVYRALDRSGRRLKAVVGFDNVTWPESQENLL